MASKYICATAKFLLLSIFPSMLDLLQILLSILLWFHLQMLLWTFLWFLQLWTHLLLMWFLKSNRLTFRSKLQMR